MVCQTLLAGSRLKDSCADVWRCPLGIEFVRGLAAPQIGARANDVLTQVAVFDLKMEQQGPTCRTRLRAKVASVLATSQYVTN